MAAVGQNVLETMEDCELQRRYRLNRKGIKLVVGLVQDVITPPKSGITSPVQRSNVWQQGKSSAMQMI